MDSDSVLGRDTLKEAIKYMEDDGVGAVAGSVSVINTETLLARLQYLEYVKGLNLVRRAQGFIRAVSIVPGPIGLFRKSAVLGVGCGRVRLGVACAEIDLFRKGKVETFFFLL